MKGALVSLLTGLQSLMYRAERETPVDRLAALGAMLAKPEVKGHWRAREAAEQSVLRSLGQDLIAFRDSLRADMRADAVDKLEALFSGRREFKHLSASQKQRLADWAVHEFVVDMCPSCSGAREVPQYQEGEGYQPMMPCRACNETGKRRYTDAERIQAMGQPFNRQMAEAHRIIAAAQALAVETAARMLERWSR